MAATDLPSWRYKRERQRRLEAVTTAERLVIEAYLSNPGDLSVAIRDYALPMVTILFKLQPLGSEICKKLDWRVRDWVQLNYGLLYSCLLIFRLRDKLTRLNHQPVKPRADDM